MRGLISLCSDADTRDEWRWLRQVLRPSSRHQVLSLACILAASLLALIDPLIMKWLIDDVLPAREWRIAPLVGLAIVAVFVSRLILQGTGAVLTLAASQRLTFELRRHLLEHVQTLPAAFHAATTVGELLQRIERDVDHVGELGADLIPAVMRAATMAACVIAAMLVLNWRLTVVILPLVPLFLLLRHRFRGALNHTSERVRESAGQQTSLLTEILVGAVQVQLLGAERRVARRYVALSSETVRAAVARKRAEVGFTVASTTVIAVGMALVLGYGGWQVLAGALTTGGLVAFYSYVIRLFDPLNSAVELTARSYRVRASIRRLRELEKTHSLLCDGPDARPLRAGGPTTIVFDRVNFAYQPNTLALSNIDIRFMSGDRVALVGASGSGKSTLVHLMARLADVECGSIRWDGRDVRKVSQRSLRGAISLVPQTPVLFKGTLRENLHYAKPDVTMADLEVAARLVCLCDVLERLPGGWDHELGPLGAGLSGGERQRVALARAVLQDRPVVVLDEATSALDAPTEQRTLANLAGWSATKILLVISHRVSAAAWADRVIVLQHGRVIEEGPHEELYRYGTRYFDLWQRRNSDGVLGIDEVPS